MPGFPLSDILLMTAAYLGKYLPALPRPSYPSWPIPSRHAVYVGATKPSRVNILLGRAFDQYQTQPESFFHSASILGRHTLIAGIHLFSFLLLVNLAYVSNSTQAFPCNLSILLGNDATPISGHHTYASAYRSQVYMNAERA